MPKNELVIERFFKTIGSFFIAAVFALSGSFVFVSSAQAFGYSDFGFNTTGFVGNIAAGEQDAIEEIVIYGRKPSPYRLDVDYDIHCTLYPEECGLPPLGGVNDVLAQGIAAFNDELASCLAGWFKEAIIRDFAAGNPTVLAFTRAGVAGELILELQNPTPGTFAVVRVDRFIYGIGNSKSATIVTDTVALTAANPVVDASEFTSFEGGPEETNLRLSVTDKSPGAQVKAKAGPSGIMCNP